MNVFINDSNLSLFESELKIEGKISYYSWLNSLRHIFLVLPLKLGFCRNNLQDVCTLAN